MPQQSESRRLSPPLSPRIMIPPGSRPPTRSSSLPCSPARPTTSRTRCSLVASGTPRPRRMCAWKSTASSTVTVGWKESCGVGAGQEWRGLSSAGRPYIDIYHPPPPFFSLPRAS